MEESNIIPVSGDHFEDFMNLTNPEHKTSRTKEAWQVLRQQIQAHVPSSKMIDLNRICVDTIRMELLIFPVVEHWKRPLTNAEWAHIEKEAKQLVKQMEKLRKLSSLVRKKDPLAFPDLAPLFNKIFKYNLELRDNWDIFKRAWSNYKKDWQQFQTMKKQLLKNKQDSSTSKPQNFQNENSVLKEIETPVSPPMFARDRWHALRISSKAIEIEILHQCKHFRDGRKTDDTNTEEEPHPGVKFLVEELRKIYLKTYGFELIERVKLIQERNDQLMQDLQPYFPEPIISAEMQSITKPVSKKFASSAEKLKNNKSNAGKSLRKFIFIILLITLAAFLVFLFQKNGTAPSKNIINHLKFTPKNKTLTAKSSTANKISKLSIEDMMQEFGSNIPVQESNARLKKMVTASPEILENIANSILQEIGKNTVFVFSEAQSLFLFWKGKLEKYASPEDLKIKLKQLEKQYKDVEALWKKMGDSAPENIKLIPDILDGKSTYALEMLDKNGDPLQVYLTEEGVVMRLSNGELLKKALTPKEAAQKISEF